MSRENKGMWIVISGPAGSGKGTVVKALREMIPDIGFSVSATTRAPRPGEIDGVNYHFITKEEFLSRISQGGMLEYNEYCGNYYGTPKFAVEKALSEIMCMPPSRPKKVPQPSRSARSSKAIFCAFL